MAQNDFTQFELMRSEPAVLPIVPAPSGAVLNDGAFSSPNFIHRQGGWRVDALGTAEFHKLILGLKTIALSAGQSIQAALDELASEGGGIIQLGAGTHSFSSNITLPVKIPIQIVGENTSSTIIDFSSGNSRFILAGTGIYTTGTVAITAGVTVTGTGTNWLSSGLVAGDQIFLDSRWYKISSITANTTIILAEGYGGVALSGATYRAGSLVQDVEIKELTIRNSTSTSGALDVDDARNILLEDVQFISNNKGIVATNISEWNSLRVGVFSSTSDGVTFATGNIIGNQQLLTISNGGHGVVASSIKVFTVEFSSSTSNTSDGYNLTSCTDVYLEPQASFNGGQGIELVSGNDNILIANGLISGNTSDGIKLTATSDNCRVSESKIVNNGGYGVNIAASTCDNNIIVTSIFSGNTSGGIIDSGTGTFLGPNIGAQNYVWHFSATDVLQASADTERSTTVVYPNTTVKEIAVRLKGTIRIKFDLKSNGVNGVNGRIYLNGVATGTLQGTTSGTYITYSEDIAVSANDLVQLVYGSDGINTVYTRNFRFYWTDIPKLEYAVNTN